MLTRSSPFSIRDFRAAMQGRQPAFRVELRFEPAGRGMGLLLVLVRQNHLSRPQCLGALQPVPAQEKIHPSGAQPEILALLLWLGQFHRLFGVNFSRKILPGKIQ